ncbi:hypothetical protein [Halanaeroarchaeum sulfurireducens]|uniref:DUF6199 domain-containing protein n=1 Tax=Halanaeroarchaeum sulfurireducens TaxID=1604004 RepID=A0A0F7P726_9EURY|nr:hypothetical protein [Halanaeroarchaeum sulfurireducens]AKH97011.1 hypothetical protein HLASF_0512 [Halanaeroarchaeum sulfurireducens]ALG81412.1 hypothetical protein HLASA_0509 [Halanaeroarchaeum sulfurireducens]
MTGTRELLAIVLGAALGVTLLVAPRAALKLSVFVGPNRRRRGDYGTDDTVSDQWVWIVRGVGVACLAISAYIAYLTYI